MDTYPDGLPSWGRDPHPLSASALVHSERGWSLIRWYLSNSFKLDSIQDRLASVGRSPFPQGRSWPPLPPSLRPLSTFSLSPSLVRARAFSFSTICPSLAVGSCCGPIAGSVCLALPLLSPPEIPIHASLGSLRILSSESLTSLDALSLRNHSRLHQPKAAFSKCTDFGRIRSTPGGGCLLLLLSLLPLQLLLLCTVLLSNYYSYYNYCCFSCPP